MKDLRIQGSIDSPFITLDATNNLIEFDGKSYPSNAFDFYKPVLAWLREYFDSPINTKTTINFKYKYINSASSQIILSILDILNESNSKEYLQINWFYHKDNEDTYEDYEDVVEEYPGLSFHPCIFED